MIDLRVLRDDPDAARASQRARGEDAALVDEVLQADEQRRSTLAEFERLRAEQKSFGKKVSQATGPEKGELVAQAKQLSEQVKARQLAAAEAGERLEQLLRQLPNIVEPGVPAGGEDDFEVLQTVGTPRDFAAEGFTPLDHLELGERLGAIDTDRGAKVSGARFYYLTGAGARLELGLLAMGMARAVEN
ncbi:MAG TPA: serine--tRNA ligase, partial [Actinomycetales bacterium]|nr:serine--tRNA ligase [Actinomycetales bacterium]